MDQAAGSVATPLIILRLRGEQALDVTLCHGAQHRTYAATYTQAVREFARQLAAHPTGVIAWYDVRLKAFLRPPTEWPTLLGHALEVLHLGNVQHCEDMAAALGLVDFNSPYLLPAPADRRWATWLIAPQAGIAHSAALRASGFDGRLPSLVSALFDVGYRGLAGGLCPYAEPALSAVPVPAGVLHDLARPLTVVEIGLLIRRLYGRKWLLFWPPAAGRLPLRGLVAGGRAAAPPVLDTAALAALAPTLPLPPMISVDVVVPTLGRPGPLADLLVDLAAQTVPPQRVLIIEQDPSGVGSLLAALLARPWPFAIHHQLVGWVGACRARNLALAAAAGEWIAFLDDDVRLPPDWLAHLLAVATAYGVGAVTSAVYMPQQALPPPGVPRLWPGFASGASLVVRNATVTVAGFDRRIEGGFGEDTDYGIRLRRAGVVVLYTPGRPVLHLKAPVGGFRYQFPHPWLADRVPPRPSPTVLYTQQKHGTPPMQAGYRLFYALKRLAATRPYRRPAELWRLCREWRSARRWAAWLATREVAE